SAQDANPARERLVTPKVALTVVLKSPARAAKQNTSAGRSKARAPLAKRFTSQAPQRPSRVLPIAMPTEVQTDPAVVTLTRKAPARMAGQVRRPKSRKATRLIPVGGHPVVALSW